MCILQNIVNKCVLYTICYLYNNTYPIYFGNLGSVHNSHNFHNKSNYSNNNSLCTNYNYCNIGNYQILSYWYTLC